MPNGSTRTQLTDVRLTASGETASLQDFVLTDAPPLAEGYAIEGTGRFRILGELGRGGMGLVYRAIDNTLGREIAIKCLRYVPCSPTMTSRFVDEALVTSQLQHPAIPAIYDLIIADGQPYLALKLIKGITLADKIKSPSSPPDRGELLAIFEQVCQAVAYAHSRCIIHRDLKPSNIMVGAFGEVQVMDWGLAKKLVATIPGSPEHATETPIEEEKVREIRTMRESDSEHTAPGTALGTPAFTSPEQTAGEIEKMDERVDVFGLGAVLCTILTGEAPYMADSTDITRLMAIRGDLSDAFERLDRCGADHELIDLCKHCLARNYEERPRNAKIVADRIAAYRAGVERRLQVAEQASAVAAAEIREQRKRRKIQLALITTVFLLVAGGSLAGWWNHQHELELFRRAEFTASAAILHAEQLAARAGTLGIDADSVTKAEACVALWNEAALAAEQARRFIAKSDEPELRKRYTGRVSEIPEGLKRAQITLARLQRDQSLIAALDKAHNLSADVSRNRASSHAQAAREYAAAFRAAGLPFPGRLEELVQAFSHEHPSVQAAILTSIDHWAWCLQGTPDADRIRQAADRIDDDPFRHRVRQAIATQNPLELLALVKEPGSKELPPATATLIGRALSDAGEKRSAGLLLYHTQRRYPADYWVLVELSDALWELPPEEATGWTQSIGCLRAALALRPGNAMTIYRLGCAYLKRNDPVTAAEYLNEALAIDPSIECAWYNLGCISENRQPPDYRAAEQCFHRAVQCDEHYAMARIAWAANLSNLGRSKEAENEIRKVLLQEPQLQLSERQFAQIDLGWILLRQRRLDEAIRSLEEATRIAPSQPDSWCCLGELQCGMLEWGAAESSYRQAVECQANHAEALRSLGAFLLLQGRLSEARDILEKSHLANSKDRETLGLLGQVRERLEDRPGALQAYREAAQSPGSLVARFEAARLRGETCTVDSLSKSLTELVRSGDGTARQKRAVKLAAAAAALRCERSLPEAAGGPNRQAFRAFALQVTRTVVEELSESLNQSPETTIEEVLSTTSNWLGSAETASYRKLFALTSFSAEEIRNWLDLWDRVRALHAQAVLPRKFDTP